MAAQALVRPSYADPLGTYATNVMGTANLLQAVRAVPSVRAAMVVTSDKVYDNDGAGRPFAEDDRLGGRDPYSSSKACAELVARSFRAVLLRRRLPDRHGAGGQRDRRRAIGRPTGSFTTSCRPARTGRWRCAIRGRCGPGSTCSIRSPAT